MRVSPRPAIAWAIGIGYALLFLGLEAIVGIDYDTIGTTTDSIVKGIVLPLVVGSIVLIIVTTWLGWWRPVLRELPNYPPRPPSWLLAVPILVFIAVLLGIDYGNLGNMGAAMILWLALGTALVGFSEEITYRGLALVGFRGRLQRGQGLALHLAPLRPPARREPHPRSGRRAHRPPVHLRLRPRQRLLRHPPHQRHDRRRHGPPRALGLRLLHPRGRQGRWRCGGPRPTSPPPEPVCCSRCSC